MTKSGHGDFCAVGRDSFIKACGIGLNAASAFLTMACGTGRDHVSTKWSATAVEKYAGIGWRRAEDAINSLRHVELLKRTDDEKNKRKPAYRLECQGDLIWLPKSLLTGVGDEIPPLKKLRQTQCSMTLRLLVELYYAQNLRDDGGIPREEIFREFKRTEFGGRGSYTVWAFDDTGTKFVNWTDVTSPHRRLSLTPEEYERGENSAIDFFGLC